MWTGTHGVFNINEFHCQNEKQKNNLFNIPLLKNILLILVYSPDIPNLGYKSNMQRQYRQKALF